jgi:hypothetical protein
MTVHRNRALAALLAVFGVAAALLAFIRKDAPGRASTAQSPDGPAVAELRDKVKHLEEALRRYEKLTTAVVGATALVEDKIEGLQKARAPATPPTGGKRQETPDLSGEELFRRTNERFVKEPEDRSWSAPAAATARQHLAHELPLDAAVESLECRTSMCRGVVVYADEASFQVATRRRMLDPVMDWTGGLGYSEPRPGPEGKIQVDEYFFRPGLDPLGDVYAEEKAHLAAGD